MQGSRDEDLHWALIRAADACLERVQELIAAGADVNSMPPILPIQTDSGAIPEEMIKAGADLNRPGRASAPLIRAIEARWLQYYLNAKSTAVPQVADVPVQN